MGYKTREWRNSMRVTLDYNNMMDTFLGTQGFTQKKVNRKLLKTILLLCIRGAGNYSSFNFLVKIFQKNY